jgi:hypothetical protein
MVGTRSGAHSRDPQALPTLRKFSIQFSNSLPVIARSTCDEAIHTFLLSLRRDGLLRCARNDVEIVSDTTSASRREAPEILHFSSAQRGRGERRMPAAPAASCALGSGSMHTSKRVHRNHPTFPHAMVLTVCFVLSPAIGLFCHRRLTDLKVLSSPVEPNEPPQDLTPASRRQDHTTSPSASSAVVLRAAQRSRRAIRPALRIARLTLPRPPHPAPRP